MTDMLDDNARRIAARGREALVARLRPAFEQAAASHSDVLELDSEQLDRMVQNAADRADGVQWRRALASVATEELGLSLGEALSHPAVARAQEIVGAPSYEESLAELVPSPAVAVPASAAATAPSPVDQPTAVAEAAAAPTTAAPATAPEPLAAAAAQSPSAGPPPPPGDSPAPPGDSPAPPGDSPAPPVEPPARPRAAPTPAPPPQAASEVRISAVHLGGIANLGPSEADLELRLSADGLDIVRSGGVVFGRLAWEDIRTLDVTEGGGRRFRRRADAHLVVHSDRGDARFEIPGVTAAELREHLAPLVAGR